MCACLLTRNIFEVVRSLIFMGKTKTMEELMHNGMVKVAFFQKVRLILQIVEYICMPNQYLKFEILKLSSITVECCISVTVLNLIHQESNRPIMLFFFGY